MWQRAAYDRLAATITRVLRRGRRAGLPAGGQVRAAEGGRKQFGQWNRAAGGIDKQLRAAGLEQELPAAPAREQGVAVPGDDRDRDQNRGSAGHGRLLTKQGVGRRLLIVLIAISQRSDRRRASLFPQDMMTK